MVLKIRLARFGRRHDPIYNIVVTHARTAPSSRPLEVLGTYDPNPRVPLATAYTSTSPTPSSSNTENATNSQSTSAQPRKYKAIELDSSRVKYWLGVGAQPSETVGRLLKMIGIVDFKDSSAIVKAAKQT